MMAPFCSSKPKSAEEHSRERRGGFRLFDAVEGRVGDGFSV
jgi:hypothetical protein